MKNTSDLENWTITFGQGKDKTRLNDNPGTGTAVTDEKFSAKEAAEIIDTEVGQQNEVSPAAVSEAPVLGEAPVQTQQIINDPNEIITNANLDTVDEMYDRYEDPGDFNFEGRPAEDFGKTVTVLEQGKPVTFGEVDGVFYRTAQPIIEPIVKGAKLLSDLRPALQKGVVRGAAEGARNFNNALSDLVSLPSRYGTRLAAEITNSLFGTDFQGVEKNYVKEGMNDFLNLVDEYIPFNSDVKDWAQEKTDYPEVQTAVELISQFGINAVPAATVVKGLTSANAIARSYMWAAWADYISFDANHTTMVEDFGIVEYFDKQASEGEKNAFLNTVKYIGNFYFDNNPDTAEANRFRLALEGALMGKSIETLFTHVPRFIKAMPWKRIFTALGVVVAAMPEEAEGAGSILSKILSSVSEIGFFSSVSRAIDNLPMDKGSSAQMRAMIAKSEGVKPEEMTWTGLDEFLKGRKNVTKAEIKEYMDANQVQIEEVVKGAGNQQNIRVIMSDDIRESLKAGQVFDVDAADALENWTKLPGGGQPEIAGALQAFRIPVGMDLGPTRNQLESLLEEKLRNAGDNRDFADFFKLAQGQQQNAVKFGEYTLPGGKNYREVLLTLPEKIGTGTRYAIKDVDGINKPSSATTRSEAIREAGGDPRRVVEIRPDVDTNFRSGHFAEPNVLAHIRLNDRTGPNGEKILFVEEVQSDWHQKGRKQGYKKETSNLDKELDFVESQLDELTPKSKANYDHIAAGGDRSNLPFPNIGRDIENFMDRRSELVSEMAKFRDGVPDAPLKKNWHEMAMRRVIRMASEKGYDSIAWTPGKMQTDRYPGMPEERKPGLRDRYDKMIKNYVSKFGKKFDTKVGVTKIGDGDEVWNLRITKKMRDSVLKKGVPLFGAGAIAAGADRDNNQPAL